MCCIFSKIANKIVLIIINDAFECGQEKRIDSHMSMEYHWGMENRSQTIFDQIMSIHQLDRLIRKFWNQGVQVILADAHDLTLSRSICVDEYIEKKSRRNDAHPRIFSFRSLYYSLAISGYMLFTRVKSTIEQTSTSTVNPKVSS